MEFLKKVLEISKDEHKSTTEELMFSNEERKTMNKEKVAAEKEVVDSNNKFEQLQLEVFSQRSQTILNHAI